MDNQEVNRCKKCDCEIEPQYYYCEKCANRRMKWQFFVTVFITLLLVGIFAFINSKLTGNVGAFPGVIIYSIELGIISSVWKVFIHADSKLKPTPNKKVLAKDVKETPVLTLLVGKDTPEGVHVFKATHPNGGFVNINDDKIYVKKSKKIKLKHEQIVKLINCEISQGK
jgi:uncharacterized integral membrane protein